MGFITISFKNVCIKMRLNVKRKEEKEKRAKRKAMRRHTSPDNYRDSPGERKEEKSSDQPEIKKRTDPPPLGGKEASPSRSFGTPQRGGEKRKRGKFEMLKQEAVIVNA